MSMPSYDPSMSNPYTPRRKRSKLPWILLGIAVALALCGGLGVLVLGGTAATVNEAVKQVEQENTDRLGDVKTSSCTAERAMRMVTIKYTITNKGDAPRAYFPSWDIVVADGTVIGQAGDLTQDVAVNGTLKGEAIGSVSELPSKFSCRLTSA